MGVLGQSLKSVNENIRLKNPVRGIAPVYEVLTTPTTLALPEVVTTPERFTVSL